MHTRPGSGGGRGGSGGGRGGSSGGRGGSGGVKGGKRRKGSSTTGSLLQQPQPGSPISNGHTGTYTNTITPIQFQLSGVRRVWGTLKSTTTAAVENALSLVSEVPVNEILVKCKYKVKEESDRRLTRWWFILRASEQTLRALGNHWQKIQIQTAWKLEPVSFSAKFSSEPAVHHSTSQGNDTYAAESQVLTARFSQHGSPSTAPTEAEHVSGINSPFVSRPSPRGGGTITSGPLTVNTIVEGESSCNAE